MPDPINNPAIEENEITKDGILDILNDETDDIPPKKDEEEVKPKSKEKEKEEVEEDEEELDEEGKKKEIELSEEDEEEKKFDDLEYKDIPRRQEILKAYPDIFKKFPGIEVAMYREREYNQIFPTVQDAREAQETANTFSEFESTLLDGNLTPVLKAVKQEDEKAYNKIVEGFIENLHANDGKAYSKVASKFLKDASIAMWMAGNKAENANVKRAAEILHAFFFGEEKITAYKSDAPVETKEQSEEAKRLEEREVNFNRRELMGAIQGVATSVDNITKSTIDKYIDPRGVMSNYIKSKAVGDVLDRITVAVNEDTHFKAILDRHWQNAADAGYDQESLKKIKNVLLSKIKTILPSHIQRVRAEALKDRTRIAKEDEEDRPRKTVQRDVGGNGESNKREERSNKKDGRGMSTYDFLNS